MTLLTHDEGVFDAALKEAFDQTDANFFYARRGLFLWYSDVTISIGEQPDNKLLQDDLAEFTCDCINYKRGWSTPSFFNAVHPSIQHPWYFKDCRAYKDRYNRRCAIFTGSDGELFMKTMQEYAHKLTIRAFRLLPGTQLTSSYIGLTKFMRPIQGPIVIILRLI